MGADLQHAAIIAHAVGGAACVEGDIGLHVLAPDNFLEIDVHEGVGARIALQFLDDGVVGLALLEFQFNQGGGAGKLAVGHGEVVGVHRQVAGAGFAVNHGRNHTAFAHVLACGAAKVGSVGCLDRNLFHVRNGSAVAFFN